MCDNNWAFVKKKMRTNSQVGAGVRFSACLPHSPREASGYRGLQSTREDRIADVRDHSPVPVRLAVCGLPPPLSLMFKVALRLPVAVGVKVTLTVQAVLGRRP